MNGKYTLIVVDGEVAELTDVFTNSVRFDGLTWEDSVELARLSFSQGFEIVIWKQDDDQGGGGVETCGKA